MYKKHKRKFKITWADINELIIALLFAFLVWQCIR